MGQFGGIGNTVYKKFFKYEIITQNELGKWIPQLSLGRAASKLPIQELMISSALKSLQSMGNKLVWLQESYDMPIARYKCLMMATTTGQIGDSGSTRFPVPPNYPTHRIAPLHSTRT